MTWTEEAFLNLKKRKKGKKETEFESIESVCYVRLRVAVTTKKQFFVPSPKKK